MRLPYIFLLPGLACLAGCATTGSVMIEPKDNVAVIAHRGASAYAPENTLAAFELAAEMGADWFELDCSLTKDGAVIVSHDDTVDRCTNGTGAISEMALAELKTLDAGSKFDPKFAGERLPALAEALELAKARIGVYVEIKSMADDGPVMAHLRAASQGRQVLNAEAKSGFVAVAETSGNRNVGLTRAVIAEIRAAGMEKQVVVQSFSPVVCLVALAEAPEIRTEFLGSYDEDKPQAWDAFLAWGMAIDVAGFNVSHGSLTPERLAWFHDRHKTVAVWTVNEKADMRKYVELGVDSIITNYPDVLREVLASSD